MTSSNTDAGRWIAFVPVVPAVPRSDWDAFFGFAEEDTVIDLGGELHRKDENGNWKNLQSIDQADGYSYAATFSTASSSELIARADRFRFDLRIVKLGD